jgi:hypothetical protein
MVEKKVHFGLLRFQTSLRFVFNELLCVLGLLVFKRHRLHDALNVACGAVPDTSFGEFGQRTGFRDENVHNVASHSCSKAAQVAEANRISRLSAFELPDALLRRVNTLTQLDLAYAEGFADRREPTI